MSKCSCKKRVGRSKKKLPTIGKIKLPNAKNVLPLIAGVGTGVAAGKIVANNADKLPVVGNLLADNPALIGILEGFIGMTIFNRNTGNFNNAVGIGMIANALDIILNELEIPLLTDLFAGDIKGAFDSVAGLAPQAAAAIGMPAAARPIASFPAPSAPARARIEI